MNSKQKIYLELMRVGTIHVRNKLGRLQDSDHLAIKSAAAIAELLHGIPPLIVEPNARGDVYFLNSAIEQFVSTYGDVNDLAFGAVCALILELERETQNETPFSWKICPETANTLKRFSKK